MSVIRESTVDCKLNFFEKHFPGLWPYIRLMRGNEYCVIITYWPYTWGFMLAANVASISLTQIFLYLFVFALSTYLWVGAAGAINDVWDKDFDKKVGRCKSRPIASGEVSTRKAVIFFIAIQIICLLPTIRMNELCQKLLLLGIIPIAIYPCSKRYFGCPSFTFGLVVNWGLFIGWASVMDNLDTAVVGPLYFGAICWTIFYDTIYGAQDNKDDAIAGVNSTYLTFGSNTKYLLAIAAIGTITGLTLAGMSAGMAWPFYTGMLACSLQLVHQIFNVDLENPADCVRKYNEHSLFGFVVFIAMLAGGCNLYANSTKQTTVWQEL